MSGNNILSAEPPCKMTLAKRADVNPVYTTTLIMLIPTIIVKPSGDKFILANHER